MADTSWTREEIDLPDVGGPLTDDRLAEIVQRAVDLRNWCLGLDAARRALTLDADIGETPGLIHVRCWEGDERDEAGDYVDVVVGAGCTMCSLPYDGDVGGLHTLTAIAIALAGRDLVELAREVTRLRVALADLQQRVDRP